MKLADYISYIRNKYHRIGQTTPNKGDRERDITNELTSLMNQLPTATTLLASYEEIYTRLTDTQARFSLGLGAAAGILEDFNADIESTIKNLTYLELKNGSLNKSFNMSSEAAEEFAYKLRGIATDLGYGEEAIFDSAAALKKLTGNMLTSTKGNESYKKSLLKTQTILREQVGITDENIIAFEQYANQIGVTTSQLMDVYGYGKDNGGFLNNLVTATGLKQSQLLNTIFEGIAKTSSDIRYNTSKLPGNLELAVLKSAALGLSVEQLSKTGEGFLNIEQSIADELEYQQLTGQRLLDQDGNSISNQYRLAELQGDRNKQISLMIDAITSQKDLLKNPVNLKVFSKMFNIAGKEVTDMIGQLNAANNLGLESILKITDPVKITAAVNDAKQAYINAGKGTAADFDKLAVEFLSNKDKIDNRLTSEQAMQKSLAELTAGIKTLTSVLDKGNLSMKPSVATTRTKAMGLYDPTLSINKTKTAMMSSKSVSALGYLKGQNEAINLGMNQSRGLGARFGGLQNPVVKQMNAKIAEFNLAGDIVLKSGKTPVPRQVVETSDALIVPDKGPILRPAANDVIAAFRPNDVIDRTLNKTIPDRESIIRPQLNDQVVMQKQTTATTNTTNTVENITNQYTQQAPALDINALANAIASAVSKIKVEATIKQDTFLGTTNMNDSRMFT